VTKNRRCLKKLIERTIPDKPSSKNQKYRKVKLQDMVK